MRAAVSVVPSRDIMRGTLRLSIVVALLSAAYTGYQGRRANVKAYQDHRDLVLTLECSSHVSNERLMLTRNEFGLLDLGKVGCVFPRDRPGNESRQFFASFEELREAREGTMREKWLSGGLKINKEEIIVSALVAFVVVNVLGLAFLGARAVLRWVVAGFRPGT